MESKPVGELLKQKVADINREAVAPQFVVIPIPPILTHVLSFSQPKLTNQPTTVLKYQVDLQPLDLLPVE